MADQSSLNKKIAGNKNIMPFIDLKIEKPKDGEVFIGSPTIKFFGTRIMTAGTPEEDVEAPLFYRWYSSSVAKYDETKKQVLGYSMHSAALTDLTVPFEYDLSIGSHVITFAASDRSGESDNDFNAMSQGGVTGGDRSALRPCVIHVLIARIVGITDGDEISRISVTLKALAPSVWDDENYQEYNHLAYIWILTPEQDPDYPNQTRPTFKSAALGVSKLTFNVGRGGEPHTVSYQPVLTSEFEGNYLLELRVVDKTKNTVWDSDTRRVTLLPKSR